MQDDSGRFTVRLAETEDDVAAAQALRYRVFVEEMGAKASPEDHALRRERDRFDAHCKHLLLIDNHAADSERSVIGVYRLMHGSDAKGTPDNPGPGFYTAGEYDLTAILNYPRETLELGRSCVDADFRGTAAMQMLWMALSQYIVIHDIGLLFGTASFHGSDVEPLKMPLSYLHHNHLAPEDMRPRALPEHYVAMDLLPADQVDRTAAMRQLPTLMKGYLRVGGVVGDGAFIDHEFNTVDVCMVMDTARIASRYTKFYARRSSSDVVKL